MAGAWRRPALLAQPIWDPDSGELVYTKDITEGMINRLAFSPDGSLLVLPNEGEDSMTKSSSQHLRGRHRPGAADICRPRCLCPTSQLQSRWHTVRHRQRRWHNQSLGPGENPGVWGRAIHLDREFQPRKTVCWISLVQPGWRPPGGNYME